jgi:Family of unknown function (DUF5681)
MTTAAKRPACAMPTIGAPAFAGAKQDGRFKPGRSGNPAGRKPGVRNRSSLLDDAISDDDIRSIVAKIVSKAKEGDVACAKLIWDRVAAPSKNRTVEIGLVEVGRYDGDEAILASYGAIVRGVAGGQISPTEALELAELLDRQRGVITELAPARLEPKPTPAEADRQRRSDEANQRLTDRLLDAIAR